MKILFWFNGSGGQRHERELFDYPYINKDNIHRHVNQIEDDLDLWKGYLDSQAEFQRWGWTESFTPELEPLS